MCGFFGLHSFEIDKSKKLSLAKRFQLQNTRILDGDVLEEWNKTN